MLTGNRIEADKWQIPVFSSNWENILSGIQSDCKTRLWESQPASPNGRERRGGHLSKDPSSWTCFQKFFAYAYGNPWSLMLAVFLVIFPMQLQYQNTATVNSKYLPKRIWPLSDFILLSQKTCFVSLAPFMVYTAHNIGIRGACMKNLGVVEDLAIICWSESKWAVSVHSVDEI